MPSDYVPFPFSLFFVCLFSGNFQILSGGLAVSFFTPVFSTLNHSLRRCLNLSEFLKLSKPQFHHLPTGGDGGIHLIGLMLWVKWDDACTSLDTELTPSGFSAWLLPLPHLVPGEGNDNPLQYSCLEIPMDRGAWRATVHEVAKESDMTEWLTHTHEHSKCSIAK